MPKLKSNFTNILNKLITDKNITTAEYRILCYLLMRAGNQDVCYPSLNTISDDTGISLSTVKRALPSLANKGYLKKITKSQTAAVSTLAISNSGKIILCLRGHSAIINLKLWSILCLRVRDCLQKKLLKTSCESLDLCRSLLNRRDRKRIWG